MDAPTNERAKVEPVREEPVNAGAPARPPTGEHQRAARAAMGLPSRVAPRRRTRVLLWPLALALTIAALLPWRDALGKAHITLALLLVVLLAAADGGRVVGLVSAALAFLGFNFFFLPPYGTLVIADPLDWFILFALLGTSVVASHLFHRVQREADEARERTADVVAIATLGADAMAAPRAAGALDVVAAAAREMLGVSRCEVHVVREEGVDFDQPVTLALDRGDRVATLADGTVRLLSHETALPLALRGVAVRRLLLPLLRGEEVIGVLDVGDERGIVVDGVRERLLTALAYFASLGAERARSERAAEHLEAMREADRVRNSVLASVSHDLRTPLTTIKALAHELGALGDERSEIIAQEADRLNRLVSDMLDLSRLTNGRFPLQPTIVPVDELLTASLQAIEGSLGDRRIEVELSGDDAFPLARVDLTQGVRIVVNLLDNARKHAPGTHPISLRVARAGDRMLIEVADRGPGVSPAEAERIFEALYRPASSRPDVGSAGLGLAIARGLAEAQGGTVTYTPRAGGGSVFTLALPAADMRDLAPPPARRLEGDTA